MRSAAIGLAVVLAAGGAVSRASHRTHGSKGKPVCAKGHASGDSCISKKKIPWMRNGTAKNRKDLPKTER